MSAARIAGFGLGLLVLCAARTWAADARCPASFAKASGACDERVSSGAHACVYPEGKCSCVRSTPCSGVPMPPGEPGWRCQAARRDGCPNDAPPQGGACKSPGKTCSYGNCGSFAYTCDAHNRAWFISGGTAPPPGMPGGGGARPHGRPPSAARERHRVRARRGKPVPSARPSVARPAARARRRRVAKRCHRCAAASRAARRRVACSSLSKRKAGGQTARARVGLAAPPRAFPAPPRRTGCDPVRSAAPLFSLSRALVVSIAIGLRWSRRSGAREAGAGRDHDFSRARPRRCLLFPSGTLTLGGLLYKPSGPGSLPGGPLQPRQRAREC